MSLELYLLNQINKLTGKSICLDALAIFFAKYFGYILIFFLFLFLIKSFKRYWPIVTQAFFAAILARFVIVDFIRWLWFRPRPFLENQINLLLDPIEAAAFPSFHAAFYFAIATIVYFYNKKVGLFFFLASLLISLARVFSGVHWPSDILAGVIVGVFSAWIIGKKLWPIIK